MGPKAPRIIYVGLRENQRLTPSPTSFFIDFSTKRNDDDQKVDGKRQNVSKVFRSCSNKSFLDYCNEEKSLPRDSFFMSSQMLLLVFETHNKYFWSCLLRYITLMEK